jgi:hypothetical protein
MKLARGRVLEVRAASYMSCARSLNNDESTYHRSADSIWFDWIRVGHHPDVTIRYYMRQPQRGLELLVDSVGDSLPRYPRALALSNIAGEVVIRISRQVVEQWPHDSVVVVRSSHPLFTDAVTDAVLGWWAPLPSDPARATTVRFTFGLRNDDVCRPLPHVPGWIPPLLGRRAHLEPAAKGEIRGRVEVCATQQHGRRP